MILMKNFNYFGGPPVAPRVPRGHDPLAEDHWFIG